MPTSDSAEQSLLIYQIKVTLMDIKPPIWRRLLVPALLTLEDLHQILQVAMGWQNAHMHEFLIGKQRFGTPDPMDEVFGGSPAANERTARLFDVLGVAGVKAVYTYDFGDYWQHRIRVEKRLPREPERVYPVCLAGERQAPPEDCGGVPGYYNLLKAIADPEQEDHKELLEWAGGGFDPEAFSVDEVNRGFATLLRPKSKGTKKKR